MIEAAVDTAAWLALGSLICFAVAGLITVVASLWGWQ